MAYDDCGTCDGTGTVLEYTGPGHNPVIVGEYTCPECYQRGLDEGYAELLADRELDLSDTMEGIND